MSLLASRTRRRRAPSGGRHRLAEHPPSATSSSVRASLTRMVTVLDEAGHARGAVAGLARVGRPARAARCLRIVVPGRCSAVPVRPSTSITIVPVREMGHAETIMTFHPAATTLALRSVGHQRRDRGRDATAGDAGDGWGCGGARDPGPRTEQGHWQGRSLPQVVAEAWRGGRRPFVVHSQQRPPSGTFATRPLPERSRRAARGVAAGDVVVVRPELGRGTCRRRSTRRRRAGRTSTAAARWNTSSGYVPGGRSPRRGSATSTTSPRTATCSQYAGGGLDRGHRLPGTAPPRGAADLLDATRSTGRRGGPPPPHDRLHPGTTQPKGGTPTTRSASRHEAD